MEAIGYCIQGGLIGVFFGMLIKMALADKSNKRANELLRAEEIREEDIEEIEEVYRKIERCSFWGIWICVLCGEIGSWLVSIAFSDIYDISMPVLLYNVIFGIVVFVLGYWGYSITKGDCGYKKKLILKKMEEKREEERKKKRAEEAEAEKQRIIDLAAEQGVFVKDLFGKMETAFGKAVLALTAYSITSGPSAPTYSRGVVRGSLADNVAVLANEVKKQEYEAARANRSNQYTETRKKQNEYYRIRGEIDKELKSMADSSEALRLFEKMKISQDEMIKAVSVGFSQNR